MMMRCLNDGTLMAFLDTELAAMERERVALHLEQCAGCRTRCRRMKQTAARIHAMLDGLDAADLTVPSEPRIVAPPVRPRLRWGAVALALAVLIMAVLVQGPQPVRPAAPANTSDLAGFLPLDDGDPVQIGVVVRIEVSPAALGFSTAIYGAEQVPADVVIGEDGRARAIRFLE